MRLSRTLGESGATSLGVTRRMCSPLTHEYSFSLSSYTLYQMALSLTFAAVTQWVVP